MYNPHVQISVVYNPHVQISIVYNPHIQVSIVYNPHAQLQFEVDCMLQYARIFKTYYNFGNF
jgi:hypothetical protein